MAEASVAKSNTDIVAAIITAAIVAKSPDDTIDTAVETFWNVRARLTGRHRAAQKR